MHRPVGPVGAAEQPPVRVLWRAIASPLVSRFVGESVFDFFATLVDPRFTARRIVARVERVRDENVTVKSFVVRPSGHFRGFLPGQHVNVTVEIDGVRHTRSYSPSNGPDGSDSLVLTVKRHPGGRVSSWLHDHLRAGDFIELGQAFGDFTLRGREPAKALLISGGSGITPITSVLRDLCARGTACDVVVLAYDRTVSDRIFGAEHAALSRLHPGVRVHFAVTREEAHAGDLQGRFSKAHLERVAPDAGERRTLACGPPGLIDAVRSVWTERGWSRSLTTETFAPVEVREPERERGRLKRVNAVKSAMSFSADSTSPLLLQAERAGLSPESGCRRGICLSCVCRKRSGTVRDLFTGAISSEADEDIRLCVSAPLSDLVLDL